MGLLTIKIYLLRIKQWNPDWYNSLRQYYTEVDIRRPFFCAVKLYEAMHTRPRYCFQQFAAKTAELL